MWLARPASCQLAAWPDPTRPERLSGTRGGPHTARPKGSELNPPSPADLPDAARGQSAGRPRDVPGRLPCGGWRQPCGSGEQSKMSELGRPL